MTTPVPEPLRSALSECFRDSCWASSWDSFEGFLKSHLARLTTDDRALFRRQFAEAITKGTLTSAQFYDLTRSTHVDVGDEEGLHDWLETCWRIFYRSDDIRPADDASE